METGFGLSMVGVVKTGNVAVVWEFAEDAEHTPTGSMWEASREYPVFAGQAGLDGPGAGATLCAHSQPHSTAAFLRMLL